MQPTEQTLVVYITVPSAEEAARLARALVDERLAACVNQLPVQSVYRWQGQIEQADELLLIVKTARDRLDALAARVRALHSYTVPEIIALPVVAGWPAYLAWVHEETRPPA
jgi:periplasmic divalent cation tolerance protein